MFDIYKPFRNRMRKLSVFDSLHTVFHFMQFLDFEKELPRELSPHRVMGFRDRMRWGIVQWEFEILAREIILNGDKFGQRRLNSWQDVAREINAIKRLENETWGLHAKGSEDIFHELVRISHRQFPWQKGITQPHISRYARLYEHAGLSSMVEAEYGMKYSEILQLGIGIAGHFLENFTLNIPIKNEINFVDQNACDSFIDKFSSNLEDLRGEYAVNQAYDINWAYTFNPLRKKPLIRVSEGLIVCPIPHFLLRRITNEIYFDLVGKEPDFSKNFGPAVQDLVGEIADLTDQLGRFKVIPETRYGTKGLKKDTADWIISDNTGHLFVECKGARVRYKGISDLSEHKFIESEFGRIKSFTLQIYKSMNDALNGNYPNWKPNGNPVYPLIVTLEDWQTLGLHINKLVIEPLKNELEEIGIDSKIVDRHPPSFCSVDTFEMALHVCNQVGLSQVFERKKEGEYPQWALETFLLNRFSQELESRSPLFGDQWKKLAKP